MNIEAILSRSRTYSEVLGDTEVAELNGEGFAELSQSICAEIGSVVSMDLPTGNTPYGELVGWIGGASRKHPVELFTVNYDLLFEQALERSRQPFFDGFTGASSPFFDPSTISNNDLPSRWTRLWKLHGSLGWKVGSEGDIIRLGSKAATELVYPEQRKYGQTERAPYSALFGRLRTFLSEPDALLIVTGFSFSDSHVSAVVGEGLSANPGTAVVAFQYNALAEEQQAADLASRHGNMSVYCPDQAVIGGVKAHWRPGDDPSRNWSAVRSEYWGIRENGDDETFLLGDFARLTAFLSSWRATNTPPPPEIHVS